MLKTKVQITEEFISSWVKMNKLEYGSKQCIKCMKISPKDSVVIVTDYKTKKVSDSIGKECKKIAPTQIFYLEDYGKRPLHSLPDEIRTAAKNSTAVFYTANQWKGEKHNIRKPLIQLIEKNKYLREAHMPGISEQLMKEGMNADYSKMQKFAKSLYSIVKNAREIHVTNKAGSGFTAYFDRKIKWIIADGNIPKMKMRWSNLPDGEVFTCVKNLSGKIVIDGCLGDYFQGLLKHPVEMDVKNGRITSIKCKNKKIEKELNRYSKMDKNANRIGEFALGINTALKHIIGNLLQDEKFPGVHIAIGHGYPEETGSGWDSKAHCDGVLKNCNVSVDGKKIMRNGKYII
jgi:leucyl aminopeptidase (aminopeptidase T)